MFKRPIIAKQKSLYIIHPLLRVHTGEISKKQMKELLRLG